MWGGHTSAPCAPHVTFSSLCLPPRAFICSTQTSEDNVMVRPVSLVGVLVCCPAAVINTATKGNLGGKKGLFHLTLPGYRGKSSQD